MRVKVQFLWVELPPFVTCDRPLFGINKNFQQQHYLFFKKHNQQRESKFKIAGKIKLPSNVQFISLATKIQSLPNEDPTYKLLQCQIQNHYSTILVTPIFHSPVSSTTVSKMSDEQPAPTPTPIHPSTWAVDEIEGRVQYVIVNLALEIEIHRRAFC